MGKIYHLEDLRVRENNIKMYPEEMKWVSLMWCRVDLSHAGLTSVGLFVTTVMKFWFYDICGQSTLICDICEIY